MGNGSGQGLQLWSSRVAAEGCAHWVDVLTVDSAMIWCSAGLAHVHVPIECKYLARLEQI